MKKSTLSLSLLIGAALTIPSLAMAAPADTAAVDMQAAATATTLETDAENINNASTDNQSTPFQISETQIISRANVNNSASQQPMTTELQAEQESMEMDAEQAGIQDAEEVMQEEAMQEEGSLEAQQDLQEGEETTEAL
ncbi:hypothetical protein [Psychrobacter aquimaris]|uniref:hypothetical protein n=1 Tax=Psychrobacter aquimaris TaxID=292733 RepID=UPI003FD26061